MLRAATNFRSKSLFWPRVQIRIAKISNATRLMRSRSSSLTPRPEKRARLDVQGGRPDVDQDAAEAVQDGPIESTSAVVQGSLDAKRGARNRKRERKKRPKTEPFSPDDVLFHDVVDLLGQEVVDATVAAGKDWDAPLPFGSEVELVAAALSSGGDSLSLLPPPHPPWVVTVPFVLPGERIRARLYRNARLVSMADLVRIEAPDPARRDMTRVKCKYFGRCAGCQYQMMAYEDQLEFKRNVVDKAYKHFSSLDPSLVPAARPTIASPKTYGYRTKITPHFDVPPKRAERDDDAVERDPNLRIGFAERGRRKVMDIEECPIATPILNEALGPARRVVQETIHKYKRGATLLLRDSLYTTTTAPQDTTEPTAAPDVNVGALSDELEQHLCITDHKAIVRERVGSLEFEFPANSFFQNNNSILVPLTTYVADAVRDTPVAPTHLVDAYCGSGLFAVSLSAYFSRVAGVEISAESIRFARHNAARNGVPLGKCTFHAGQAEAIFASVADFPPESTVVVVDPPRKGCDAAFVQQLLAFGPATVVYVSCNVHTQARDVGMILKGGKEYRLESLRGFDLFPQTAHVESVAILRRGKL